MAEKRNARNDGFSDGVIYALACLTSAGDMGCATYEEILRGAGPRKIIERARNQYAMRWSGLDRYLKTDVELARRLRAQERK